MHKQKNQGRSCLDRVLACEGIDACEVMQNANNTNNKGVLAWLGC